MNTSIVSGLRPERLKELTLGATIVVSLIAFTFLVDGYMSGRFFNRLTLGIAVVAVMAAGQTLVILTRNVDLSVGSIAGVSAYVTGQQLSEHPDTHVVVAVLIAVGIGAALGLVNGFLVAVGRVPAIIATLGTLAIYRTFLIDYGDAQTITAGNLPSWVVELPQRSLFSIGDYQLRTMFAVAVIVVVALQLVMSRLRTGRRLYALGSNPEASHQAGLNSTRLTILAFGGCGALAGLGGFLFLARFGTITVTAGQGLELQAIAAVVVGGVSIQGGSGTMIGALFGASLIEILDQSLVRVPQISEFWREAVLGLLILLAVVLDAILTRRFRSVKTRVVMDEMPPPSASPRKPATAAAGANE
jgi:rhamnose transport system permease protein